MTSSAPRGARSLALRVGTGRCDDSRAVELGDLDGRTRHPAARCLHEDRLPGGDAALVDDHLPRRQKRERYRSGLHEGHVAWIRQDVRVGDDDMA